MADVLEYKSEVSLLEQTLVLTYSLHVFVLEDVLHWGKLACQHF
jgi:hypothetical protein